MLKIQAKKDNNIVFTKSVNSIVLHILTWLFTVL